MKRIPQIWWLSDRRSGDDRGGRKKERRIKKVSTRRTRFGSRFVHRETTMLFRFTWYLNTRITVYERERYLKNETNGQEGGFRDAGPSHRTLINNGRMRCFVYFHFGRKIFLAALFVSLLPPDGLCEWPNYRTAFKLKKEEK